ncbi:Hypothetical predicted protein [Marmota monax]|uniref:Neuromedin U C-terminal domain-containing protein n=1 Tax=Marmota monax TaxID=9995 RepID=A0A5E4BGD6_MARMO|nr:Hypothetical predicted protein [Marmota monax]
MPRSTSRRPGPAPGQVFVVSPLLLLLLAWCTGACGGAPIFPQGFQPEQELQLWNEEQDEKDNAKRFLFHYSKTQKLGNSNVVEEFQSPFASRSKGYFLFRDPNEDTEWNEILRDFGILPPKEEPKDEIEEMVLRLQKEAMVKPYEKMSLAQLKEAEDEFDEEDMKAIEVYSIPMCLLVNQHLSLLARKFPETKFVKAIVNSCIQHYHDNCLPTIFVYKSGQIEGKFIGIVECGGINLKLEELEWKLAEVGAIQTELEENPKKVIEDMMYADPPNQSKEF